MKEAYSVSRDNVEFETLTELSAIAAIGCEWNALLARSKCNLAFSSAPWFAASCRANPDIQPHVIVARRGNAIVAVLPLVLIQQRTVATFLQDFSDYNDIIAAQDDLPAAVGLMEQALKAHGAFERITLSGLRQDSNCIRAARSLSSNGDFFEHYVPETTCPFIRLHPSYDEYLQSRSKSFRTSVRQAHRYADRDNVHIQELSPDTYPARDVAEVFLALHLDRFVEHSCFVTPMAQAFVREAVPALFAERRLRAFALYELDSIIGINLCMVGPDGLCLWNGGFTAHAERWSPGTLLISAGIQEANAAKMTEYDFMRGSESYKSRWATDSREIGRLEFEVA